MHKRTFVQRRATALTASLTLVASLAITIADFAQSAVKAAEDSTITTDYHKDRSY